MNFVVFFSMFNCWRLSNNILDKCVKRSLLLLRFSESAAWSRLRRRCGRRPLETQGMGSKLLVSLGTSKHSLEGFLISNRLVFLTILTRRREPGHKEGLLISKITFFENSDPPEEAWPPDKLFLR